MNGIIKVNPNRMELMKLKRRLAIARRGHKLLKDKLDELLRQLVSLMHQAEKERQILEKGLMHAFQLLLLARGEAGSKVIQEALMSPAQGALVDVGERRLLSIKVPTFNLQEVTLALSYSLTTTPAILDRAVVDFEILFANMVRLTEREKTIEILALEIEKTRRRVNALEYILIPQIEEAIRRITMSLGELERANLTRLMRIKEMLAGAGIK